MSGRPKITWIEGADVVRGLDKTRPCSYDMYYPQPKEIKLSPAPYPGLGEEGLNKLRRKLAIETFDGMHLFYRLAKLAGKDREGIIDAINEWSTQAPASATAPVIVTETMGRMKSRETPYLSASAGMSVTSHSSVEPLIEGRTILTPSGWTPPAGVPEEQHTPVMVATTLAVAETFPAYGRAAIVRRYASELVSVITTVIALPCGLFRRVCLSPTRGPGGHSSRGLAKSVRGKTPIRPFPQQVREGVTFADCGE